MSREQPLSNNVIAQAVDSGAPVPALKFGRNIAFQAEIRRRVDQYFKELFARQILAGILQ